VIVVVSGVSGVGKTTVGRRLAPALSARFVDADDYHPAANVAKMSRGEGLDDDDRAPWLAALRASIEGWLARGEAVVLACSALKASYREALSKGDRRVRFVVLEAPREVVEARLASRRDHFAGEALLDSQLSIQEHPVDALIVDATRPLDEQIAEITAWARGSRSTRS
jgi:carbohydrate kinase (thermoresistant glucokinase family)